MTAPIWPAQLDHLCLQSPDPVALADFYVSALGFNRHALTDGNVWLEGMERRLIIGPGPVGGRSYHAFRLQDVAQLSTLRHYLDGQKIPQEPSPSPLFDDNAIAVRDPDGWLNIFGLPRHDLPTRMPANASLPFSLPARLQHVVVATNRLPAMMQFYEERLGLVVSDYVLRDMQDTNSKAVAFYRSDPEHHSFAVFQASNIRADHHCYETPSWNHIRDWADHFSNLHIPIWWGPGRHGPGNNLFFMIKDPDGQQIEISSEIEYLPQQTAPRYWPMTERSVNLWGVGWIRD